MAAFLPGCSPLATAFSYDDSLTYIRLGGEDYAIPEKHTLSTPRNDGGFIIASWPEMEGRTKGNYLHWTQSNIGILLGQDERPGAIQRSLDIAYDTEINWPKKSRHPDRIGMRHGFVYSRIYKYEKKELYERFRPDGSRSAFMVCGNETTPGVDLNATGREPRCEIHAIYPEFPKVRIEFQFDRPRKFEDILEMEKRTRELLAKFRANGAAARAAGKFT